MRAVLALLALLAAPATACDGRPSPASVPDTATSDTDTPDAEPDVEPDVEPPPGPLCDAAHPPLTPTPDAEVTYTTWSTRACLVNACLCDDAAEPFLGALLRCEPYATGFYWSFGSVGVRVLGRSAEGTCRFELVREMEGSASRSLCDLPLPAAPWAGLAAGYQLEDEFLEGFPGTCEPAGTCCIQPGCPDPCGEAEAEWPLCANLSVFGTPCDEAP